MLYILYTMYISNHIYNSNHKKYFKRRKVKSKICKEIICKLPERHHDSFQHLFKSFEKGYGGLGVWYGP